MDDATRARWREVQEGYAAALKLARAAWPADVSPGIVQAAATTLLEAFDRRGAPVASAPQNGTAPAVVPPCPECGGPMAAVTKTNPKQPDFRCRDRQCDKAVWTDRKRGR